jgi:hypothetical protein
LTRSLAERIQQFEEGIYQIAVIDNAIRVKTLSKAIVAQKIRFWESRSISNCNHMIGGIAVFFLAVAYGILKKSPLAGIGALVGIAYAFYEGFQKILSRNELQGLYRQYFHSLRDRLASAHDDKTKLLLLGEVACYSPLASHIYRYALIPQEKVDQMEEVYARYINFLGDYNSVDARIKREMERVDESHKILIEMIEKEETLFGKSL